MAGRDLTTFERVVASLLRRLAATPQGEVLVLRGSLVTAAAVAPHPRPSADVDFVADLPFDRADLERRLAEVLAVDPGDGVEFGPPRGEIIWAESQFPGLRSTIPIGPGEGDELQIDIGVGDPLVGGPIERAITGVPVLVCRPETLLAWKVHGLFEHGRGTWRAKDLHDCDLLIRFADLDPALVTPSLRVAFESRGDSLALVDRLLRGEFGRSRGSRRKWRRFATRAPAGVQIDDLPDVLARVSAYVGRRIEGR